MQAFAVLSSPFPLISLILFVSMNAVAAEVPVLEYSFRPDRFGVVRDLTGNGHHGVIQGQGGYIDSGIEEGLLFSGKTVLVARDTHALIMHDAVTLDVWLRVDDDTRQGCVIDKQRECYRLSVTPGGGFFFGLKGEGSRADLYGKGLVKGQWHRITATFSRPLLALYLDGKKCGEMTWDHSIGPGGRLFLGAKSGSYNAFQGALQCIRIYDYPRPPENDDRPARTEVPNEEAETMEVDETVGAVVVDAGALRVVFDQDSGAVRSATVGSKILVSENAAPPLFGESLISKEYRGLDDVSPDAIQAGVWQFGGYAVRQDEGEVELSGTGQLIFPGGFGIGISLTQCLSEGSRHMRTRLRLSPIGVNQHQYIRSIGVQQPFSLNVRKRVIQAGDQGVTEDVRYHYQFHTHVRFLSEPDQNWWRHFYTDQPTKNSFVLWRAEGEDTAGIVGFRGRQAAGWSCAYDRQGGVLFAYRDIAVRAPKCLYTCAEGGGAGTVYLHAPTHPAISLASAEGAASLLDGEHEIDWIFFEGEEAFARPERQLAAAWGVEKLRSDGRNDFDLVDDGTELWRRPEMATEAFSPIVQGGIPFPRGRVTDPAQFRVFVGGIEQAAFSRPLAYWPDQSIKWLLVGFPLDVSEPSASVAGGKSSSQVDFKITTRTGAEVPARILFGEGVHQRLELPAVRTGENDKTVMLDTGEFQLELSTGRQWLRRAVFRGVEMVSASAGAQSYVDFLRIPEDGSYPVGSTHPVGTEDPGPVNITKIDVEERGFRTVVRLEGMAECTEPVRVILRLDVWAGRPYVRLFHTVEFLHADPRTAFVRRMGLSLTTGMSSGQTHCAVGGQDGPVAMEGVSVASLLQTSQHSYSARVIPDGGAWPKDVAAGAQSRGWIDVSDDRAGLCVIQRNMWQEYPKELRYDRQNQTIEVGYWPAAVPLMDCRRYSNYPHRAQGESAPPDQHWVVDEWYKNDPVKGISRTHETILFFHGSEVPLATLDAVAADFQSPPLIYPGWEWIARTGATMPLPGVDGAEFAEINANMLRLADWWLFHQRAYGWYGMWDYGDVQHHYRSGYGRIFSPEVLRKILAKPEADRNEITPTGEYPAVYDYHTQNDWAYDNGRWGWSNTEGLVNHFMSLMYLRTGRRDLYFFLEANARHSRDVDARHAGMWFGKGTRHGVQHWSDGNHEERQTTFTEQRFHYLLSGEYRTREWNEVLTRDAYLKGTCSVHAAHSGRTYCLLTNWEMTGGPEIGATVQNYMRSLAQPSGIAISAPVAFPSGTLCGDPKGLNEGSMFFYTFGAMHAMLEYYYLTDDAVVRDSIIKTAEYALAAGPKQFGGMYRKAVAFAARHAQDGDRYASALAEYFDGAGSRYAFRQVGDDRRYWTGMSSFLVGNVSGGMFWANDCFYTLGCLENGLPLSTDTKDALDRYEPEILPQESFFPAGSWQDEYDKPEFDTYTRDRLTGR